MLLVVVLVLALLEVMLEVVLVVFVVLPVEGVVAAAVVVVVAVVVVLLVALLPGLQVLLCCVWFWSPPQPPVGSCTGLVPGGAPSKPGDMFFHPGVSFAGDGFTSLGMGGLTPGSRAAAGPGTGPSSPS